MGASARRVIQSKDLKRFVDVDGIDKALICMNEIHYNIHRGIFFTMSHFGIVVNEGFRNVVIVVTSPIHARFTAAVSGDCIGEFFVGTTFQVDGANGAPVNRNGFSSKTSDAVFHIDPTVLTEGTSQVIQFLPGGSGGNAIGGTTSSFEEWIMPAGTYLLQVGNVSGQTRRVSVAVEFYQPNLA